MQCDDSRSGCVSKKKRMEGKKDGQLVVNFSASFFLYRKHTTIEQNDMQIVFVVVRGQENTIRSINRCST